jgi:hypothetical protein
MPRADLAPATPRRSQPISTVLNRFPERTATPDFTKLASILEITRFAASGPLNLM